MQISGSLSALQSLRFQYTSGAQAPETAPPAPAAETEAPAAPPAADAGPVAEEEPRSATTLELSAELIARFRAERGVDGMGHDRGLHLGRGHHGHHHGHEVRERARGFGHEVHDRVRELAEGAHTPGEASDRLRGAGEDFRDGMHEATREVQNGEFDRRAFLEMLSGMFDDLMSRLSDSFDAEPEAIQGEAAPAAGERMPRDGRIETPRLDERTGAAPSADEVALPEGKDATLAGAPGVEEAAPREVAGESPALDFGASLQELVASLSRSFETMFAGLQETLAGFEASGEEAGDGARILDVDAHFQLSLHVEEPGSRTSFLG